MSRPTIGSSTNPVEAIYTKRLYTNRDNFIPVGTIIPYASNLDVPSGYLLCDGSAYSRAIFSDLFAMIGTLYGEGDGSTTFNVPDLRDKFVEGSVNAGTEKEAGLPNIEGTLQNVWQAGSSNAKTGAFADSTVSNVNENAPNATRNNYYNNIVFDASLSSPIYGNSDTVQPMSITFRYLIKAIGTSAPSSLPEPELSGATLGENIPLGIIMPYTGNNDIPEGFRLCNGDAISRTTYSDLFNLVGTTYGEGDGITTFNLPDLTDKFIEGSVIAGTEKDAGLPNIKGAFGRHATVSANGAFTAATNSSVSENMGTGGGTSHDAINFDAAKGTYTIAGSKMTEADSPYGKSDTVQPPALTMRYIIRVIPPTKMEIIESNTAIGIGAVQQFLQNSIPDGWLSLEEGSIVSRTTYPNLWAWVQENAPLITDEEWLAKASTQKAVAYYSTGDGETTFRLPRLLGFAEGKTAENVGELSEAGLPNIEGSITSTSNSIGNNNSSSDAGALKSGDYTKYSSSGTSTYVNYMGQISFDASQSNSIYGNSDTVQPESFGLVWCVKAYGAAIKQGTINITSLANDVLKKADCNFSNITSLAESVIKDAVIVDQLLAQNGYIKFANGLILQWGFADSMVQVTLPIAYTTYYGAWAVAYNYTNTIGYRDTVAIGKNSLSSIRIYQYDMSGSIAGLQSFWITVGY